MALKVEVSQVNRVSSDGNTAMAVTFAVDFAVVFAVAFAVVFAFCDGAAVALSVAAVLPGAAVASAGAFVFVGASVCCGGTVASGSAGCPLPITTSSVTVSGVAGTATGGCVSGTAGCSPQLHAVMHASSRIAITIRMVCCFMVPP